MSSTVQTVDILCGPSGGGTCPRQRCGSMPSRSRTSSEGSVQNAPNKLQTPNCTHQMDGSLCLHGTRPHSMYSPSLSSSCSPPFYSVLFRYLSVASERPNHHHYPLVLYSSVTFIFDSSLLTFYVWFSALTG